MRVFTAAPRLLEMFLDRFYYQRHTNTGAAAHEARLSPCKASRIAPDAVSEEKAAGIDNYEHAADYSPEEKAAVHFAEHR